MRILQVTSYFPPTYSFGGVPQVAYGISKELVRRGHEVTVFTTDGYDLTSRLHVEENPMWIDGIKVFHFRNYCYTLVRYRITTALGMIPALSKSARCFDLVHLHEYRSSEAIIVRHFATKFRIPYVLQPHGQFPITQRQQLQHLKKIFDKIWGKSILRDAARLIAVSESEIEQFKKMGVPSEESALIPNGIDLDKFNDLPQYGKFRTEHGLRDKPIILFLGRLDKRKRIDFLIDAFNALVKEIDNVVLVIAGPDGGNKTELIKLVDSYGISDKVKFTGYVNSTIEAYRDADLLVSPGFFEVFGLVPFEAILCNTPVIVTDDCGCGEWIKELDCGHLVRFGDVRGLKELMKSVLEDPSEIKRKTKIGKGYIEDRLNWRAIASTFEQLYEDCINTNARAHNVHLNGNSV
jgi:glycosyltransferase involved in cell wall biosynthesis